MKLQNQHIRSQLAEFRQELMAIPSGDVLVHCDVSNTHLHYFSDCDEAQEKQYLTPFWKRILKVSDSYSRASEVKSLCLAISTISWDHFANKTCNTPIFLVPVTFCWTDNKTAFQCELIWDAIFLNPFFVYTLQQKTDKLISLSNELTLEEQKVEIQLFLTSNAISFSWNESTILGNFHPHRFELLREIEGLENQSYSQLLAQFFGEEDSKLNEVVSLSDQQISPLDQDQTQILQAFETNNVVVEGPPGTGKSVLLSNLTAKLLFDGRKQLVLSDKRTALDVIYQKLKAGDLHHFAYYGGENHSLVSLLQQTQITWKLLENQTTSVPVNLLLSHQKRASLQGLLDKLNASNLLSGCSYNDWRDLIKDKEVSSVPYVSSVPTLSEWLISKQQLQDIYNQVVSTTLWKHMKYALISSESQLQRVDVIVGELRFLQSLVPFHTFGELILLKRNLSFAQIIENEIVKKYSDLFYKSDIRTKFRKYAQIFKEKTLLFEITQKEFNYWKIIPSNEQVAHWEESLQNGSWFHKRKIRKQILSQLVDTTLEIEQVLQSIKRLHTIQATIDKHILYFHRLGILQPQIEIPSIELVLHHWEENATSDFSKVIAWTSEQRASILKQEKLIHQVVHWVETYLSFDVQDIVFEVFDEILTQNENNVKISFKLTEIEQHWYAHLVSCNTFKELELRVLKHYSVQLETYFPMLANFSESAIYKQIEEIISFEQEEQQLFVKHIIQRQVIRFHQYQELLLTSATKLDENQKQLKNKLKNGKRLLVKLFAMTRPRMSMRELILSDAWEWLQLLHPCWLLSPSQMANLFPLEQGIFDVLIIDEASQLPVIETIGALQRSKRAFICGDSKQMSPTYYFSKRRDQIDALHQASFYFKSLHLKHHYRSQHPALIAFSNKHFYKNELLAYPSAAHRSFPLYHHFVEQGRFINRVNEEEAQAVANVLHTMLTKHDSIGVVAFSKEQLDAIWKHCSEDVQSKLLSMIESGNGFFKTLEHVQGEECDLLLVAMGYAKNERNHFHLRMGPLNRLNGYKRLNVLFTRARLGIHFFTSVQSTDFPWTDNETMNLLRWYLQQLESKSDSTSFKFPYLHNYQLDGDNLKISNVYQQIQSQEELVTTISVLKSRGWKIS